jgi:hypothetical protein
MEATVGFEPTHRGFADPRLDHLATSPSKSGFHYNLRQARHATRSALLYNLRLWRVTLRTWPSIFWTVG